MYDTPALCQEYGTITLVGIEAQWPEEHDIAAVLDTVCGTIILVRIEATTALGTPALKFLTTTSSCRAGPKSRT